jgi:NhaP-type Na+/H+ or K+/H+ antiporter
VTTDQIYLGLGLTLVLAVGSQVLGARLRIPALIVLLPVGFIAGTLTDIINPNELLGATFQPLVSLSVAVILYDAGLGLDLARLEGHTRRVVVRLLVLGVAITWVVAALVAAGLLGMSKQAAVMFGAILVVSGPTVVGPLLSFVRPTERLQRILMWEGSLIDPIGGLLGAVVFHAVTASTQKGLVNQISQFVTSIGVGVIGGAIGTGVLWLLVYKLRLAEALSTAVQLATVVAVAAVCDVIRDDTGLIAAIVMGLALANMEIFDMPARQPFFEILVQLVIGVLFISISATVTPQSIEHLLLPTLGLVAVLVLVVRPFVSFLSTRGTDLTTGERRFVGWMDPRGIVAAATASTFSAVLVAQKIGGASKILPGTFLVIVMTVTLYGLTAAPVARRLGVIHAAFTRPLLVGGDPWVIDLGRALQSTGVSVLMWAETETQRESIGRAGLELAPDELLAAATGEGAELEGITAVLLLTSEDGFNALAATLMQGESGGPVYRLEASRDTHGIVASFPAGHFLFDAGLTGDIVAQRYREGAHITVHTSDDVIPTGHDVLFRVRADGQLALTTHGGTPPAEAGDTAIALGPAPAATR